MWEVSLLIGPDTIFIKILNKIIKFPKKKGIVLANRVGHFIY